MEEQTAKLDQMILEGRLPIASKNLQIIPTDDRVDFAALVEKRSYSADLVILGFTEARLNEKGSHLLLRHPFSRMSSLFRRRKPFSSSDGPTMPVIVPAGRTPRLIRVLVSVSLRRFHLEGLLEFDPFLRSPTASCHPRPPWKTPPSCSSGGR